MNISPRHSDSESTVAATFTACAAAATLALGSTKLSAGNAAVTACTASPLTATRNVDNSGTVTQLNVAGIPTACYGETLSVTLVDALERPARQHRHRHRRQLRRDLSATVTGFGPSPQGASCVTASA